MFDIEIVIDKLKETKRVFYSEAHFQLELAWIIKDCYGNSYDVNLEYTPSDEVLKNKKKMHIDILLKNKDDGKIIPIELKYRTKSCVLKQEGEPIVLANHAAKDIGCYLYLNDIRRIELIKEVKKSDFEKGYAIMLTNDLSYTKPPRRRDCVYSAFSLDDGNIKTGTLQWGNAASEGTKKGIDDEIKLTGKYLMKWNNYIELPRIDGKTELFKYLVSEI